jgi:signal transduction histidine kinase
VLATDGLASVVVAATALVLGVALLGTVVDRRVTERLRAAREHERLYREAEAARAEAEAAKRDAEARTREAEQLTGELQEQATELEQQTEEAQALAAELEAANEALQVASAELEEQTEAAERARAEADAARARLTRVFEQAPVAVVVVRGRVAPDLVFELVNPRYLEMLPPGREPRGRRVRDVLPEIGPELLGALQGVLDTGVPFLASDFVMPLDRDGDGAPEDYYFNFVYHPLVEADGVIGGVVGIGTEVTDSVRARQRAERLQHAAEAERERAEAERERAEAARAAAETANRARADFLASMSHELRTPLNAIGGYAQLLEMGLHGAVTDAQRGALGRVQKAQTHLLGLINDVLNFAKLEAGRVEFDVRVTSVADVVREVMPLVEPQLRAKGLRCEVALPGASGAGDSARGDEPALVWADADKLGQVLLNLLSNAVKFTPPTQGEGAPEPGAPGRVTVALAGGPPRVGEEDGTVARLLVRDTGVGIPAEKQAVVFDPFVQVSTGLTRTSEGTGLGLAISRDLARGMGGDLTVESVPGAGATFTVTLRRVFGVDGTPLDRRSSDGRRVTPRLRDAGATPIPDLGGADAAESVGPRLGDPGTDGAPGDRRSGTDRRDGDAGRR